MKLCEKDRIIKISLFTILMLLYMKLFRSITGTACIMSATTGFPCPGCGMTRAWINFFKGDFLKAFKYNPLFLIVLFVAVGWLFIYTKKMKLKSLNRIIFIIVVLFLAVYIIRMVLYFPNIEPMTYNKKAFLPRIISLLNR